MASGHSTASLAQALSGIDFPTSKDKMVEHARKNHADQEVLQAIQQLPDSEYANMADVFKGSGGGQSS